MGPLTRKSFSITTDTVFDPELGTGSQSSDMEGRLYILIYATVHRGRKHLWILVSAGDPGTDPLWILRENFSF